MFSNKSNGKTKIGSLPSRCYSRDATINYSYWDARTREAMNKINREQVETISDLKTQLQDKDNKVLNLQKKQKILQKALIIMLFFGVATAVYVYKNRPAPVEPSRVEPIMPPKIPEQIKIKPKKGKKR